MATRGNCSSGGWPMTERLAVEVQLHPEPVVVYSGNTSDKKKNPIQSNIGRSWHCPLTLFMKQLWWLCWTLCMIKSLCQQWVMWLHGASTVHNDADNGYFSAPDGSFYLPSRSSNFKFSLTVAHWQTHIDTEYPPEHVASSSNPNTQRYSQTLRPCQLQHLCLFMYLCGFPVDLSSCWVLRAAAI